MNTMDIESRMAALERLTAEIQTFNGNIASIRQVIMDLSVELDKLKESNRPLVELKDEIERVRQAKKDYENQSEALVMQYDTQHQKNEARNAELQRLKEKNRQLADRVDEGEQDDERNGTLLGYYCEKKEDNVQKQQKAKQDLAKNQRILEEGKPTRQRWMSLVERAQRVKLQAEVSQKLLDEDSELLREEGLLERYRETFSESELERVQLLASGQLEAYLMQEE